MWRRGAAWLWLVAVVGLEARDGLLLILPDPPLLCCNPKRQ